MAETTHRKKLLHIRSNQPKIEGGKQPKLPEPGQLEYGEIAINYGKGMETLAIKNSENEIVTFSKRISASDVIINDFPQTTLGDELDTIYGDISELTDAISVVPSDNVIYTPTASGTPKTLTTELNNINNKIKNIDDVGTIDAQAVIFSSINPETPPTISDTLEYDILPKLENIDNDGKISSDNVNYTYNVNETQTTITLTERLDTIWDTIDSIGGMASENADEIEDIKGTKIKHLANDGTLSSKYITYEYETTPSKGTLSAKINSITNDINAINTVIYENIGTRLAEIDTHIEKEKNFSEGNSRCNNITQISTEKELCLVETNVDGTIGFENATQLSRIHIVIYNTHTTNPITITIPNQLIQPNDVVKVDNSITISPKSFGEISILKLTGSSNNRKFFIRAV